MADGLPHTVPEQAATQSFSTVAERMPVEPPANPEVPGYEIIRLIGRGGMGVVYEARDRQLQRTVALKMILMGPHAGAKERERFRQEAEAVARLQHPGIVQIFEVGDGPTGPFLALEYVAGGSLAEKLDGKPWLAAIAANLIEQLAEAVEAAHQSGIVHRDLKPANVLLSDSGIRIADAKETSSHQSGVRNPKSATAKLTDFGLAKRLDSGQGQTNTGAILGTPSYMAPEQAEGKGALIGPPTDVYALGAILYELLTGRPPFVAETPFDTVMQVSRQEPVPPTRLNPKVPRDLETICLKCLRKEPERRYATAAGLVEDLRRFQDGRPILARPVGPFERGWRWCRRNPGVAASLAAVALVLIVGSIVAAYFAYRAEQGERDARASAAAAKKSAAEANEARERGERTLYDARINLAQNALRDNRLIRLRELLGETDPRYRDWEWNYLYRQSAADLPGRVLTDSPSQLEHSGCISLVSPGGRPRLAMIVPIENPGPKYTAKLKCEVRDVATGDRIFSTQLPCENRFHPVDCALSANGRRVIFAADCQLTVWDVDSGKQVHSMMLSDSSNAFAINARGDLIAFNDGSTVKVYRIPDGKLEHSIPATNQAATIVQLDFGADGRNLFINRFERPAGRAGATYVVAYHIDTKVARFAVGPLPTDEPRAFALSGDGHWLFVSTGRQTLAVWDALRSRLGPGVLGVTDRIESMAASHDGRYIAIGASNGLISIHDRLEDGASPILLRGHDTGVFAMDFSSPVKLVSVSGDGVLREWNLGRPEPRRLFGRSGPANGSAFEPVFSTDGKTLAQVVTTPGNIIGTDRRELIVVDTATNAIRLRRDLGLVPANSDYLSLPRGRVALSPDGSRVAFVLFKQEDLDAWRGAVGWVPGFFFRAGGVPAGSGAKAVLDASLRAFTPQTDRVRIFDVARNRELGSFADPGYAAELTFNQDGKLILLNGYKALIHDAATGKLLGSHSEDVLQTLRGAFHPDGRQVALAASWQLHRGEWSLAASSDEPNTAPGVKSTVTIGPTNLNLPRTALPLNADETTMHIHRLQFSPTGRYLAAVAVGAERVRGSGARVERPTHLIVWQFTADGSATRLWGAPVGAMLPYSMNEPMAVAFAPDESTIAAGTLAGQDQALVATWDLVTGQRQHAFRLQTGGVEQLDFTPNGLRLIAVGSNRSGAETHTAHAHVWDLTASAELLEIPLGNVIGSSGARTSTFHFDGNILRAAGWNDKGGELRELDGSAVRTHQGTSQLR
jgi:serine/threonine protein kinase/WD40 repeat protein